MRCRIFQWNCYCIKNEFFSNNSLEYLKTDDSNMPEDRAGKEDTAERLLTENREVVYSFMVEVTLEK